MVTIRFLPNPCMTIRSNGVPSVPGLTWHVWVASTLMSGIAAICVIHAKWCLSL